jgi:hypothetical protein
MVTKVTYGREAFEENWSLEGRMWMTTCLLSAPPSPFNIESRGRRCVPCNSRTVELQRQK